MSSDAFDIQIPATEVQIAESLRASDPDTADTIRRLAFERDRLIEKIRNARREQSQIVANAMAELDPPVCRLQFPDGSVPGNAREAAEGWKRWADEFQRRAVLWERLHDQRMEQVKTLQAELDKRMAWKLTKACALQRNTLLAILAWCDRGGEEPEGQCLHEIEQQCRKALGLEILNTSHDWCANASCPICAKEIRPYTEAS